MDSRNSTEVTDQKEAIGRNYFVWGMRTRTKKPLTVVGVRYSRASEFRTALWTVSIILAPPAAARMGSASLIGMATATTIPQRVPRRQGHRISRQGQLLGLRRGSEARRRTDRQCTNQASSVRESPMKYRSCNVVQAVRQFEETKREAVERDCESSRCRVGGYPRKVI